MQSKLAGTMALILALSIGAAQAGDEAAAEQKSDGVKLESFEQRASYTFGQAVGRMLKDTGIEIQMDQFVRGFSDSLAGNEPLISEADQQQINQDVSQRVMEKREKEKAEATAKNQAEGAEFLAANKKKEGIKTTESGLQYEVIKMGDGPKPTADNKVKVHYHGTFINGEVFDSSVERDKPAEFGLGMVIKGWTEGLQLMPVGSKFKFYIPFDLAYGSNGRPGIPPCATLIFEVELLEITGTSAANPHQGMMNMRGATNPHGANPHGM